MREGLLFAMVITLKNSGIRLVRCKEQKKGQTGLLGELHSRAPIDKRRADFLDSLVDDSLWNILDLRNGERKKNTF